MRAFPQMIGNGELGHIEAMRDTMRDPNPPHESYIPTSGGLFRDMVIHDFDCVRWLMGCEPVEIFAMGANLVDPVFAKYGDIDTCAVTYQIRIGCAGRDRHQPPLRVRLRRAHRDLRLEERGDDRRGPRYADVPSR